MLPALTALIAFLLLASGVDATSEADLPAVQPAVLTAHEGEEAVEDSTEAVEEDKKNKALFEPT